MAFDEELADRLREIVRGEDGVSEKRMFGGLAFLIDGNLAVSASSQGGLLLRIDPTDAPVLLTDRRAQRFTMRGRAMDGWLRVDADGMTESQLMEWVACGVRYARSLPAK